MRRAAAGIVGLAPTMGALHQGHLAGVAELRKRSDTVVMSVFVNPLQFEDASDLERYPRDLDRDAGLAADAGVDLLFAPSVDEMYPEPPRTRVRVEGVSEGMEGAHRPGHFEGVATVVTKLLAGIRPAFASFGRKDAQQLAVVKALVRDLSVPVQIVEVPTVREHDGLALSSRNVFIEDRASARSLSAGLFAAADAAAAGERDGGRLEALVAAGVAETRAVLDYAALADAATAERLGTLDRPAFLAVAARVGGVRLIDNLFLWPDGSADRGTRLEGGD